MILSATLAATCIIMLPTSKELSLLFKYSASLRKTKCVILKEFEANRESNRLCGRMMEAVIEFTEGKFKLSSFHSFHVSINGLSSKETVKTCDPNFWMLTS